MYSSAEPRELYKILELKYVLTRTKLKLTTSAQAVLTTM